jgi:hypothetical protein
LCDELLDTSKQAMTVNNGNIAKWESAIDELKTHNKGRVNYQSPYLNIEINSSHIEDNFDCAHFFIKLLIIEGCSDIKYSA